MADGGARAGRVEIRGLPASPGVAVGRVAPPGPAPPDGAVVVAGELSPAEAAALDPAAVRAVATAAGGPLSHAAILVRSLGIPAVTGAGPRLLDIAAGTVVLVDGDAGTVEVDPGPQEVAAARDRRRAARSHHDEVHRDSSRPAQTVDGRPVQVLANVAGAADARAAVREGADGVGMLRTEFAFLGRSDPPGEDEQYAAYREVAYAVGDRPLVVRTLDLGADVPAWDAAAEPNPALGLRGIRLTLSDADLFGTQLRAVARLGRDRPIGVMFPMVTTVEELRQARAALSAVSDRPTEVGITVEIPAAALTAEVFAAEADFLAVGTNDLTQYTLAADRGNAAVARLADGLHPAVLRLIGAVTAAAGRHGRTVCAVGELVCDPLALPVLLGLGVTALSVRPNAVAEVKHRVRRIAYEAARDLAGQALGAESAEAVRALASGHRGRDG